jgi:hypothetical protein
MERGERGVGEKAGMTKEAQEAGGDQWSKTPSDAIFPYFSL